MTKCEGCKTIRQYSPKTMNCNCNEIRQKFDCVFVLLQDNSLIEKCPCHECLVQVICKEICQKRIDFYLTYSDKKKKS
jgi:hypothetical protein